MQYVLVCSKRPFLIGTLAQLARTVRQAVQTSVPFEKGRLEHTALLFILG